MALASVFIWIGFVGAISFMEAWLKFQAPGVDLPLGLGIGRLVFHALNKVEWVLALLALASLQFGSTKVLSFKNLFFLIPITILFIQTFSTLPILDARAQMHIDGLDVPSSNTHFLYIAMEVVKVSCLLVFGIKLMKT